MRKIGACATVLCLLGTVIYVLFFSQMFVLKKVECGGCSDEVRAELSREIGKNIFKVKTARISEKLLESDLTLFSARVKIKLPDKLEAELRKRIASFRLTNSTSSRNCLLVDNQGVILDKDSDGESRNLPELVWQKVENLNIGDRAGENVVRAAEILDLLEDSFDASGKGYVENNNLTVRIVGGPLVKFDLSKETIASVRALQLTMDQVKMDSLSPKEVDLRFNNPIVVN